MQIKLITTYKSIEIALKYTKMTKSKETSKTRQIVDFRKEKKPAISHMLLYHCHALGLLL